MNYWNVCLFQMEMSKSESKRHNLLKSGSNIIGFQTFHVRADMCRGFYHEDHIGTATIHDYHGALWSTKVQQCFCQLDNVIAQMVERVKAVDGAAISTMNVQPYKREHQELN